MNARVWLAAWLAGALAWPAAAQGGVDNWIRACTQDVGGAWCEQQGRRLAATGHADAAAAFNINSGFSRWFAAQYGTVVPGARTRPGAGPTRGVVELKPADQDRVRTPEGLRLYLGERAGKGNARADFLYAGASKGAERAQWMQRAAAPATGAGDADAMYVLGYLYANGLDGLRRDDALAYRWFAQAAQAGNAAALGVQARLLAARGAGGRAEALRLAGQGCDRNAQSACIVLADLSLAASDGADVAPEEKARLVESALKRYSGVLLNESRGFTLEPERQAALYALATIYVEGRYLPPNKVEARDDLVRALNVDGAMVTAAWMTYADELIAGPDGAYGFGQDVARGLEILHRFADMGDPGATLVLGTLLLGGHPGVPADPLNARALLKRAAAGGDAVAMTALARHYAGDSNDAEAFHWVQQAMAAGNPYAYYLAAGHYRKGRGTAVDEDAARAALEKSCDTGYLRACIEVGNDLLLGTGGFATDPARGAALLEKARRDGSAEASFALGTLKLRTATYDNAAQLQDAVDLLVEAGKRGSRDAGDALARIAGGDNAILRAALARARGEPVPEPVSVQEAAMQQAALQEAARAAPPATP